MHRRMIFKVWFLGLAQHANSQVPSWTCWIRTTGGGLQSWVLTDPLGDSDAMLKFESPWHRTLEMVSFHFTAEWSMEEEQKPRRTLLYKVLFSSVTQLCPTLCDPMDCSTPGFPVHHQLPELAQTHPSSWWCHPAISSSVVPFSSHLQSFPASGSFQMSQFFTSGGQRIGVSASVSVLLMNTQDWSPLGWTGWISLQSKGLSRVFSNTTVQKHQFFSAQLSSQSNSHIHTWLLEKP